MRRFFILMTIALALLGLSSSTIVASTATGPTRVQAPVNNSLQVVDSSPAAGEELGLQAEIILYFDRPVDCGTAQSAISLAGAGARVPGTITCSDSDASVHFAPSAALDRGQTYTVTVSADIRGQDGSQLADAYQLQLNTTGFLQVSQVLPADGSTDVETKAAITVIFNRPVAPLVAAEDAGTLPNPLTFSPAVQGHGEWLNTSIYVFRPDPPLQSGTQYSVSVDSGLQGVDGSTLSQVFQWKFTTAPPTITQVTPLDLGSAFGLNEPVQITFSQPMDRASVESAFYLRPSGQTSGTVSGNFTWSDDSTGFSFKPDQNLQLGTVYEAGFVPDQAHGEGGGAPLSLDPQARWSFSTVLLPGVINTDPYDGQTDAYPYGSFTIYFASPMNVDTLKDNISIDPKPAQDPDFYYSDYDNSYNVSFQMDASTTYTITLAPGMADIYGNAMQQQTKVSFTTRPFDPQVVLQVPGPVGFYNAYNDATQLFLTHMNISRVDLSLYSVTLSNFETALTGETYYDPTSSYQPAASEILRQWQITPDTPLNTQQYELLNLGQGAGGSVDCPGAPASRLKVGDVAVVVSTDAIRARASVPNGEILTLLYKDYSLPITGGPTCSDGILWWEVRLRDGRTAWVAEGISASGGTEYFLDVQQAAATTEVNVSQGVGSGTALPPGVYYLTVRSPETDALGQTPPAHFLIVGTANLTLKVAADNVLVWATDVNSGEPIANAPITVYDNSLNVVGSGSTDADGLLKISTPRLNDLSQTRFAVLQSGNQFGIGVSGWSDGIDGYNFGVQTDYNPFDYKAYVYTDRPVYRPGQPVYFRGIVRQRNDVTYTPPNIQTIPVTITDDQGNTVYQKDVPVTSFGTFSDQFNIADDATLGYYRISTTLPGTENQNYYTSEGTLGFIVAQYRVPEFQVNVTSQADAVVQGDTVHVTVDSKYFFGGSVSGAQVDYSVVSQPYFFNYTGQGGYYSFQDFDVDAGPSETFGGGPQPVSSGTGTTDAQGQFTVDIPATLEDASQSQTFTIEATVTDESGQAVSGRVNVTIHKGLVYVGVQPQSYVGVSGQQTGYNLLAVDWNSQPAANQQIDVQVVERRWSNVQQQDEFGRTTWSWQVQEIPVTSGTVTTDAQGKAVFNFTPPNGGIFKLKATAHDSAGNAVVSGNEVWVTSPEYVSWRQQNSNRIDLIADKQNYEVGDTAEVLITSPFQGSVDALITVERGEVLQTQRVTMTSNSYLYRLPITEDDAPNVYVSVVLVKGVDANNPVAAFRMGMVGLAVDNQQKAITITITPDKDQAGPGDTVNYTVRTTDYAGNPVQAEVGVGLTDLASLSIADPNSGPILDYFYGSQALAIRTAMALTINTDQLTQETINTIKGGGGGFGEGGIFDIREQFVDTAYWNATLTTDATGAATFSVKLPDNLTTWRLDARAVTSGSDGLTLVGQGTFDLLSTKPLLIRPVTPRFFVVGDQVTLAAIVNNNTNSDQSVAVSLQAQGVTLQGDASQTVTIAAGARQRIEWPVTVDDSANVDLTFFANGNNGAFTDASKPPLGQGDQHTLPVYKYEVPETVGTGGVLRTADSRMESIQLPRRFNVTQGELDVNVEPSLAATTLDSLNYLQNYPYQCLEQTVSRFLPNIMTYRALKQLNQADDTLTSNLNAAVNYALQRLFAEQHSDGGWGWFVQDESNPLTTAYALIGLAEAKNQGFPVSDNTIQGAEGYLRTTFIVPGLNIPTWQINRQAFILYALARAGAPDVARTTNLYDSRAQLDIYTRAFLALTLNLIDPNDTSRTNTLMSDLVNAASLSATGAHWTESENDYWNWNTDTRTTAIALDALVKLSPTSDLIPNVVRYLMVERRADGWETTQETAWAVMSLTDWMSVSGELQPNYTYSATLNGNSILDNTQASPDTVRDTHQMRIQVSDLLTNEANSLVINRSDGPGVLYYTAHLKVYLPVNQVQPLDRGIVVERRYTMPGSNTAVTQAAVGDLITVHLTIIAPTDLHYVIIADPIPAGTDAVNPNLATNQQIGTQPELNPADPLSQGWGWWWFSNIEFRDEKVVLYSTYLPAGTYEYVYTIRAGLTGTFNVIPATGQEFYFPEVYGRSAGSTFTITAGQ